METTLFSFKLPDDDHAWLELHKNKTGDAISAIKELRETYNHNNDKEE